MGSLIILVGTFAVFWLLFIRPQQARVRAHQALVATLEVGDEVVTTSGIHGTIRGLDADDARLEIAPGVEVRIARQAIARRQTPPGDDRPEGLDDFGETDDDTSFPDPGDQA